MQWVADRGVDFQPQFADSGVDCQPGYPAAAEREVRKTNYYVAGYVYYHSYRFSEVVLFWDEFWGNLLGERKARCCDDDWHVVCVLTWLAT